MRSAGRSAPPWLICPVHEWPANVITQLAGSLTALEEPASHRSYLCKTGMQSCYCPLGKSNRALSLPRTILLSSFESPPISTGSTPHTTWLLSLIHLCTLIFDRASAHSSCWAPCLPDELPAPSLFRSWVRYFLSGVLLLRLLSSRPSCCVTAQGMIFYRWGSVPRFYTGSVVPLSLL